jgi:mannose-1-phosphate guanylyltransferase
VLKTAVETAERENSLVTIGIEPNRPETGYGYIRRAEHPDTEKGEHPVYQVRNFTEKPDLATAETFLNSGDYLWNSGMFIWKVKYHC